MLSRIFCLCLQMYNKEQTFSHREDVVCDRVKAREGERGRERARGGGLDIMNTGSNEQ